MRLIDQEHYEMMAMFDRLFKGQRLDKEHKSMWPRGIIYQDGRVNELFLAFRHGVAYGTAITR